MQPSPNDYISRRYIVLMLEEVQEYLDHNPEVDRLSGDVVLIETLYSRLHDAANAQVQ